MNIGVRLQNRLSFAMLVDSVHVLVSVADHRPFIIVANRPHRRDIKHLSGAFFLEGGYFLVKRLSRLLVLICLLHFELVPLLHPALLLKVILQHVLKVFGAASRYGLT